MWCFLIPPLSLLAVSLLKVPPFLFFAIRVSTRTCAVGIPKATNPSFVDIGAADGNGAYLLGLERPIAIEATALSTTVLRAPMARFARLPKSPPPLTCCITNASGTSIVKAAA